MLDVAAMVIAIAFLVMKPCGAEKVVIRQRAVSARLFRLSTLLARHLTTSLCGKHCGVPKDSTALINTTAGSLARTPTNVTTTPIFVGATIFAVRTVIVERQMTA